MSIKGRGGCRPVLLRFFASVHENWVDVHWIVRPIRKERKRSHSAEISIHCHTVAFTAVFLTEFRNDSNRRKRSRLDTQRSTAAVCASPTTTMKNIFVTGGAGFIGSHTALCLLENGYKLTIVDNLDNSFQLAVDRVVELAGDKGANLTFVKADLRSFDDMVRKGSRARPSHPLFLSPAHAPLTRSPARPPALPAPG